MGIIAISVGCSSFGGCVGGPVGSLVVAAASTAAYHPVTPACLTLRVAAASTAAYHPVTPACLTLRVAVSL